ncbi:hypothetical protein ABZ816_09960 [Actinosynnema sp. NPDC047251]|uniref:Putative secreted protein n=1 Tax=Saccharothrix espanaensis (strain ATCC 51144 / DSM 44229 / JCM 9112 / NBRC 15066 / NRRL 15764) TaxID=1179773 RepID=K0K1Q4_SACES|nr:hypothetical protein [Saccharothrix espanaensis]CCH34135.1 putative secreted protein [Saccharothrix espanaensis DSM 44229]
MLYIVALLVLAALGLLVPALTTDQTYWAWLSVGASAAAALVLIWDWALRRGSGTAPAAGTTAQTGDQQASADDHPVEGQDGDDTPGSPDQATEPEEEDTDAADLLIVADLKDEIRVLDERPRYHLAACPWLAGRASLGLPIAEARQLGFTPCAVCAPDSTLAAKKRTSA